MNRITESQPQRSCHFPTSPVSNNVHVIEPSRSCCNNKMLSSFASMGVQTSLANQLACVVLQFCNERAAIRLSLSFTRSLEQPTIHSLATTSVRFSLTYSFIHYVLWSLRHYFLLSLVSQPPPRRSRRSRSSSSSLIISYIHHITSSVTSWVALLLLLLLLHHRHPLHFRLVGVFVVVSMGSASFFLTKPHSHSDSDETSSFLGCSSSLHWLDQWHLLLFVTSFIHSTSIHVSIIQMSNDKQQTTQSTIIITKQINAMWLREMMIMMFTACVGRFLVFIVRVVSE